MTIKIKEYKNKAWVTLEHGTLSVVKLYKPNGQLHDKIKCDTKGEANAYFKAFCAIAKNL